MLNGSNSRPSVWDKFDMSKSLNYEEATWLKKTQAACGLGHAWPGRLLHGLRATWVAHCLGGALPGPRGTWAARCLVTRGLDFSSPPPPPLGSSLICSGIFSIFIRVINRVLETRFPCGCHMEKYATLDHIRPWKSSFKNSIYRPKLSFKDSIYKPKSSLIDLRC